MLRKIFKIGHSLGVTIPKKFLENIGLKLGDAVKIEIETDKDRGRLVVSPANKQNQLALGLHSRTRLGSAVKKL